MAFTGIAVQRNTDEQLGAFSGYVRRPEPNNSGMTAQIFGENGDDADTILALSLSKYQDIEVFVTIHLIKDFNGQIMKENDTYPRLCSFNGFVRRSKPKREGMVAQIFAPNGKDADEVAKLSMSNYQDCLVFVDIRGNLASKNADVINTESIKIIDNEYVNKLTKNERAELESNQKKYKKLNQFLELDFLTRIEVLTSLGNKDDYISWLDENALCSFSQEEQCTNDSKSIEINGLLKPFNYLTCCDEHKIKILDEQHLKDNELFYEMRHRLHLRQWAMYQLKKKFSKDGHSEPEPNRVIEWASQKNIAKYLPNQYKAII